jgi:ADP-heptose:LPS heptosyltransferase
MLLYHGGASVNIQPQSGLGDLLFSLPLIYDVLQRENVDVASNHSYAAIINKEHAGLSFSPIECDERGISEKKEGYTFLRYDRYGVNFFDRYYLPHSSTPLSKAVARVREIYSKFKCKNNYGKYAVFAPPRAAQRHARRDEIYKFSCTPDVRESMNIIKSFNLPVVLAGKNDLYHPDVSCEIASISHSIIDLRNCVSFFGLCDIVANAECVISQASAITALAGLYAKPTRFLKAATETDELHKKHIDGMIWPDQIVI